MVFNVFGSRDLPRDLKKPKSRPRSTQRAPKARKKSNTKNHKKCLRGKKCLKPAISFLTNSGTNFRTQICTCFKHVLHNLFLPLFRNMLKLILEPILGPILGPDRPKRGQDEPKRTIKSFKESKTFIFKNL